MKEKSMDKIPFRLGTTSYIIPDDILPNVRFLAGKVDDVELVLFEVEDGGSNLPDAGMIGELKRIAEAHAMTYTVHLPLDLKLGGDRNDRRKSIEKALSVIENTRPLQPYAYILHLDGREVISEFRSQPWQLWQKRTIEALEDFAGRMGEPHLLAVENLDNYPPQFWDGILDCVPVSRCIDIGHLWRDGHEPLPYLREWLARARVLHVHGCGQRDHQSLTYAEPLELRRILEYLIERDYHGVMTMEIFGREDFESSRAVMLDAMHGLDREAIWEKS